MAKERIFATQTAADFLVLNADNDRAADAAARSSAQVYWFSRVREVSQGAWVQADSATNGRRQIVFRSASDAPIESIVSLDEISLKGAHNIENVLAAVCAARLAGVSAAIIAETVGSFHAVEHRLEFVTTSNGVDYYNDSKATNVDATAKAIASFPGCIHLILGGKDKNSNYADLSDLLRQRVKAVYTIGTAAAKIESHIRGVVPILSCETLERAVDAAANAALPGDVVLLAPACSSFDQFESYEHRGRVFKQLVLDRCVASLASLKERA
jgi:UDP-N-acetylmuramoylalanine--D-glutamate ligase